MLDMSTAPPSVPYVPSGYNPESSVKKDVEPRRHYSKHPPLAGRRILLTGGTSGIGLAIAKRALIAGASHIYIITRDAAKGEAAVAAIREATKFPDPYVTILEHDFNTASETDDGRLLNRLNHNTLVNCAGMSKSGVIVGADLEAQKQLWLINYHVPFKLSKHLMSNYLRASKSSQAPSYKTEWKRSTLSWCIVNVSSLLAVKGGRGDTTYAATKAALNALTRALTLECGDINARYTPDMPPLRVNAVLPGYIDTPMTQGFTELYASKLKAEIPLHRFGTPEEVADAVVFLLENEYANNCTLNLDGGLSAL